MKGHQISITLAILIFMGNLFSIEIAEGQSFQLKGVKSIVEEDKIAENTAEEVLEKERGKIFVISFLKASFEKKFDMTTDKYQKTLKNVNSLKRIFDKESYTKIDFIKIELSDAKTPPNITLKTNLHWFMEGYDGSTTIYFILAKIKGEWLLDWLIY